MMCGHVTELIDETFKLQLNESSDDHLWSSTKEVRLRLTESYTSLVDGLLECVIPPLDPMDAKRKQENWFRKYFSFLFKFCLARSFVRFETFEVVQNSLAKNDTVFEYFVFGNYVFI